MSLINRLRSLIGASSGDVTPAIDGRALRDFLSVIEVADATESAGPLFLKKFKHPIPDYPRHFIMQYEKSPGDVVTLGTRTISRSKIAGYAVACASTGWRSGACHASIWKKYVRSAAWRSTC